METKKNPNESTKVYEDRRKYRRFDVDFQVKIVASDRNDSDEIKLGQAINISKDGVCMKTTFCVPVSSVLFLSITYGGQDSLFLAEVVWKNTRDNGYLYGLHIVNWTSLDELLEHNIFGETHKQSLLARQEAYSVFV